MPDLTLDDVVGLVHELPTRVRSLRVETRGWTDVGLSRLASDRVNKLLARHVPGAPDAAPHIERTSVASWMALGEGSWNRPMFDVLPTRWREEHETTSPYDSVRRSVHAHDEDTYWWDQGHGVKVTDGRNTKTSLFNAWVVGTRWTTAPAELEVLESAAAIGRPGVRVRMVPQPGVRWTAGLLAAGDVHEFVLDLATGMKLSVTSFVGGSPLQQQEVVDFEPNAEIPRALTTAPADAEMVAVTRRFEAPQDVANAAAFPLLAPTWLPDHYTFQTGSAREEDDTLHASLIFSRDRREFVTLYQQPEWQAVGDDVYEWQRVERGQRAVLITDLGDEPGERIAQTTLGGTMAVIYASIPGPDLLELAFSLEVLGG